MTTTTTTSASTAIAVPEPVFSAQERLALAGVLAGYTGLTREAYALDLRQFTAWCQQRHPRLVPIRRAAVECFARGIEARGRPPAPRPGHHPPAAVHHRRVLPLRRRGRPAGSFPGRACPPPAAGL